MAEVMERMREEDGEVVGLGEVENCGLEARERRSLRCHENGGRVEESNGTTLAQDREGDDEGDWSVFFDKDEGIWKCQHCIWTYRMCFPSIESVQKHEDYCNALMAVKISLQHGSENGTQTRGFNSADQTVATISEIVDQFVAEKSLQNGQSEFEAKERNGHADFSIKSQSQTLIKMNMDDGSKAHLCSETKTETRTLKTEIVEDNEVKVEHKSILQVTEFDVERVLEEQETHDLYCPNCNSCITKRVILRKRKRTGQGFKYDIKHIKVQETQNDLDVSAALTEIADEDRDREREVFRCLACFSFFIPTEGGFNIFGIFGKREDKVLTDPQEIPARNRSWSSIFGTMTGKQKENRAGFSLPGESSSGAAKQVEDAPRKELDDTKSDSELKPGEGQGLSEQKGNSKEGRSDGPLIYIPGSEVHGVQIIIGEKVDGSNNNKTSGKTFSEGPEANSDKGKSDTHLIDIPVYEVHGIQIIPGEKVNDPIDGKASGDDIVPSAEDIVAKPIGQTDGDVITPGGPHLPVSVPPEPIAELRDDTQIFIGDQDRTRNEWDVLKSIVYGGLIESITSLGVVSSAAGSDASTLNIVALGLANLIGGLFVIIHDLLNLRGEQHGTSRNKEEPAGRYWEQLGRRDNFRLHATVAVISYLIFGLLPPAIYGFSFMKSDNKEYKLIAIAAASLLCIALLAIGKANVRLEKDYFKCLSYYIGLGVTASGLSYVAGVLIHRFLEELHLFDPESNVPAPPFDGSLLSGSKSPFLSSF